MPASGQKDTTQKHNRAVVCVIAGLTTEQAENISSAIIHAKNTYALEARGTIATGKEEHIAGMIGEGQNTAIPQQKKKKKKSKNTKNNKTNKEKKNTKNNSQNEKKKA